MSTYTGSGTSRNTLLAHSRTFHSGPVARKRYRGPLPPASEATLAKRAQEARQAARGTCESCWQGYAANGSCGC